MNVSRKAFLDANNRGCSIGVPSVDLLVESTGDVEFGTYYEVLILDFIRFYAMVDNKGIAAKDFLTKSRTPQAAGLWGLE